MIKSKIETTERNYYQVQRRDKKGAWRPLYYWNICWPASGLFEYSREGLKRLKNYVDYCKNRDASGMLLKRVGKSPRRLGKLRIVKVKVVRTEQKFYTPTKLKVRR